MRLRFKRVLVTGGAGFLGSQWVDALAGCRVRVLDDSSTGSWKNLASLYDNPRLEIVRGDVRDRALLRRALTGIEVVYHFAGRGPDHADTNPHEHVDIAARGIWSLMEECEFALPQRVVVVSCATTYGTANASNPQSGIEESTKPQPNSLFAATKLLAEGIALKHRESLPITVVRPFGVYGTSAEGSGLHRPSHHLEQLAQSAFNYEAPSPNAIRFVDWLHIRDFMSGLRAITESESLVGQVVNLGTGVAISPAEQVRAIYDSIVGPKEANRLLAMWKAPSTQLAAANLSKLAKESGFVPSIPFRLGIATWVDELRRSHAGLSSPFSLAARQYEPAA